MTAESTKPSKSYRISDRANKLSPSGIRKFFDLLNSIDGVISLGVGEPDYATPWPIIKAAMAEKTIVVPNANSTDEEYF